MHHDDHYSKTIQTFCSHTHRCLLAKETFHWWGSRKSQPLWEGQPLHRIVDDSGWGGSNSFEQFKFNTPPPFATETQVKKKYLKKKLPALKITTAGTNKKNEMHFFFFTHWRGGRREEKDRMRGRNNLFFFFYMWGVSPVFIRPS